MRKVIIIITAVVVVGGGLTGLWWQRRLAHRELWATGTLEATKVEVSAKVTGRILTLAVKAGSLVKADDLIALLDASEQEATARAFQAQAYQSQARLKDLLAGAREQEIKEAKANLEAAQAEHERASKDWRRAQELFKDGALSTQETDSAKNAYVSAKSREKAAQERLSLLLAGARPQEIEAARAEVQQARATLTNAENNLANYTIYAPLSGRVLTKNLEAGEMALPGLSIITLADIQNPWVRVYIPEEDMGKIKYNGQALVYVDAFPRREFQGTITEIAEQAEFTPKNIQTKKERVNLVFGVKVSIENKDESLKPGMPAEVKFIGQ